MFEKHSFYYFLAEEKTNKLTDYKCFRNQYSREKFGKKSNVLFFCGKIEPLLNYKREMDLYSFKITMVPVDKFGDH